MCLEEESAFRSKSKERWLGRAACFLAAKTGDEVLDCEEKHPFPLVPVHCDKLLAPEDIQAELGISMRLPTDEDEDATEDHCSQDFHGEAGEFVLIHLRSQRTETEAKAIVKGPHPRATQVKLLPALGDTAQRFVSDSLCRVALAKGSVTMVMTLHVPGQACAFDAFERLATKAAAHLP
ncbi:hypothetical protein [Polyangium sp. 6x1]|uniref:hypothetical protein n=1 Tax=Polyangium sp. 6x1 TaxID=3042689 RepID=UPI002482C1A1|nr:hypothetical protein [Polyangium sp. 6x1]MDI1442567.1 hypothetical protein [Polyangium sp. 6x1]